MRRRCEQRPQPESRSLSQAGVRHGLRLRSDICGLGGAALWCNLSARSLAPQGVSDAATCCEAQVGFSPDLPEWTHRKQQDAGHHPVQRVWRCIAWRGPNAGQSLRGRRPRPIWHPLGGGFGWPDCRLGTALAVRLRCGGPARFASRSMVRNCRDARCLSTEIHAFDSRRGGPASPRTTKGTSETTACGLGGCRPVRFPDS